MTTYVIMMVVNVLSGSCRSIDNSSVKAYRRALRQRQMSACSASNVDLGRWAPMVIAVTQALFAGIDR